ncbi:uncharacterized protein [Argopecten irradians]|uniref:uncharacterized protein n=1 Tax=Argopecten irradians TaxID=31199 RepID=UPI00371649C4
MNIKVQKKTSQEITPDPDSSNGGMIQAPFINLVDTRATIDGTGGILEVLNEVISVKFHWSDFPQSLEGTGCVASGVCVDTPLKTLQKKFSTVLFRLGKERNFTVDLIYDLKESTCAIYGHWGFTRMRNCASYELRKSNSTLRRMWLWCLFHPTGEVWNIIYDM